MKYLGSLLGGGLADSFGEIGTVGAGGAVIGTVLMLAIGLWMGWPTQTLFERSGFGALLGAPISVIAIAGLNVLLG